MNPASTEAWNDEALHVTQTVEMPRGITLRVSSVRRSELVVAVNQKRLAKNEDITGLRAWDFGRELAKFVVRHNRVFSGKRFVEMGAGLGILSLAIACSCKGAVVTATDASSLDFLERNVEAHRAMFVAKDVSVQRLLWTTREGEVNKSTVGSHDGIQNGEKLGEINRASSEGLLRALGDADIVIGTDLLYHLTTCEALFATVRHILKKEHSENDSSDLIDSKALSHDLEADATTANGGIFILGGHSRYYGTIKSIREMASAHDFIVKFVDLRVLSKGEGFEYCAGDFLAIMASHEATLLRFASDVNRDTETGDSGSNTKNVCHFKYDDAVTDNFEEDDDDDNGDDY